MRSRRGLSMPWHWPVPDVVGMGDMERSVVLGSSKFYSTPSATPPLPIQPRHTTVLALQEADLPTYSNCPPKTADRAAFHFLEIH